MNDFVKPPKKKTALNVGKLSLSAPNPQVKGVYATLKWDVFQNNPRVVVDTRDPNLLSKEYGFGRIQAALSSPDFFALLELIKMAGTIDREEKWKIECLGHDWVNGQKSPEITPQASVWVGRDGEGQAFISVVNEAKKGFPIIKFIFGTSDQRYTRFLNKDGSQMSKPQASQLFARAYANLLGELMPNVLNTHYYEMPPGQFGGNRGGGYNRGGQGGGGGYQNRQQGGSDNSGSNSKNNDVLDDDIPF